MSAITTGRLIALLTRLEEEPGSIALMAEVDLELPAEMDYSSLPPSFPRLKGYKHWRRIKLVTPLGLTLSF